MRRPTFKETPRTPPPAGAREVLRGKEKNERDGLKDPHRIPIPMLLIIGALMGASD